MTREKAIEIQKALWQSEKVDYTDEEVRASIDIAIEAIRIVQDVIEYLNDPTITWRDVADDIIADIVVKHGWNIKGD